MMDLSMSPPFSKTKGRNIQAEGLPADRVQVWQLREDIVRELGPMLAHRFENFCAKLVLNVWMLRKQVKDTRERVRCCVHPSEDKRATRRSPSVSESSQRHENRTHAICPSNSSSGNLSSSFALMFACTVERARQSHKLSPSRWRTYSACS